MEDTNMATVNNSSELSGNKGSMLNLRRGIGVVALAAVTVLAYAAYRFFTNRPGEAAVQYIPADAAMVLTFDGTPSERQVVAFAKIAEAMKSAGISDLTGSTLSKALQDNPVARDLMPYVSKNIAAACWASKDVTKTGGAVFFAVTDPGKVQSILAKDCKTGPESGVYSLMGGDGVIGVIDSYLVMSSSQKRFDQIKDVAIGKLPSVATLSEYKSARAALPSDSNLMVFVSPEVYASLGQPAPTTEWNSVGAAVRDDGLAVSMHAPGGKMVGSRRLSIWRP